MSRVIKFRAWDGEHLYTVKHIDILPNGELFASAGGFRDSTAVMQYTGLLDKNGVEIYECDIVCERNIVGAVQWTWELLYRIKNREGGPNIYPLITNDLRHANEFVVIGNIYENPELLDS